MRDERALATAATGSPAGEHVERRGPGWILGQESGTGLFETTQGLVERRAEGSLDLEFLVTDTRCDLAVMYSGVLPDLFREGQGVVAHGRMNDDVFVADRILAKHDENYMAPEVADSLAQHVDEKMQPLSDSSTECNSE